MNTETEINKIERDREIGREREITHKSSATHAHTYKKIINIFIIYSIKSHIYKDEKTICASYRYINGF